MVMSLSGELRKPVLRLTWMVTIDICPCYDQLIKSMLQHFFIFVGANLIAEMLHFERLDYLKGGGD